MLHNRSTLILAGLAIVGYCLYTRLNAEEKQEIINDLRQKTNDIVDDYLASQKAEKSEATSPAY